MLFLILKWGNPALLIPQIKEIIKKIPGRA